MIDEIYRFMPFLKHIIITIYNNILIFVVFVLNLGLT